MQNTLHYIYDPLCGWCYGVSPLLAEVVNTLPELPIKLHAGGLFTRQAISPAMVQHIRSHDARIQELSGKRFGEITDDPNSNDPNASQQEIYYLDILLQDGYAMLDSAAVIAAILSVEKMQPKLAIPMLVEIQQAHYLRGMKVVEQETLAHLAGKLGLDEKTFCAEYQTTKDNETRQHILATQKQMAQTGVSGFPAFFVEQNNQWLPVDHNRYYGNPQEFSTAVKAVIE